MVYRGGRGPLPGRPNSALNTAEQSVASLRIVPVLGRGHAGPAGRAAGSDNGQYVAFEKVCDGGVSERRGSRRGTSKAIRTGNLLGRITNHIHLVTVDEEDFFHSRTHV